MEIDLKIIQQILDDNKIDLGGNLFAVMPNCYEPDGPVILVQGDTNSKLVSLRTYLRYKNLNDLVD